MKFGLHLVRKGVITAGQLVDALEYQQRKLVPIGQLALEECILSAPDIFKVLCCQSDMPHERFGELAVNMGLMTQDDLRRLLVVQSDRIIPLHDVLVRLGILSCERVDDELVAYRREKERHNAVTKRRIRTAKILPSVPKFPEESNAEEYAMTS